MVMGGGDRDMGLLEGRAEGTAVAGREEAGVRLEL